MQLLVTNAIFTYTAESFRCGVFAGSGEYLQRDVAGDRERGAHGCVPRATFNCTHKRVEPPFKLDGLASLGKCQDSERAFAEHDRINDEVAFVDNQPGNDLGIRPRLCGLNPNKAYDELMEAFSLG